MGVTTIYKCDCCGKETQDGNAFFSLFLMTVQGAFIHNSLYNNTRSFNGDPARKALWCKECCVGKGVHRPEPVGDDLSETNAANPAKAGFRISTLEDLIRDIVREELSDD